MEPNAHVRLCRDKPKQQPRPDKTLLLTGCGCVEVVPVGMIEGHPSQHQRQLIRPLRLISEAGKNKVEIVGNLKFLLIWSESPTSGCENC